jgi:hypothetical protein
MRPHQRHTIRLLTASAALAGVVAFELTSGPFFVPDPPQEVTSVNLAADTPVTPLGARPDISEFAEVTARPLFSPSRRPYQPSEEPKVSIANTQTFDLIGVTISAAERSALLRTRTSNQGVVRVVEGQAVGGWEVRAIEPTQVTLGRANGGEESTVLTISEKRKKYAGSAQAIREQQATKQTNRGEPQQREEPQQRVEPQQNDASAEGPEDGTPEE